MRQQVEVEAAAARSGREVRGVGRGRGRYGGEGLREVASDEAAGGGGGRGAQRQGGEGSREGPREVCAGRGRGPEEAAGAGGIR